MSDAEERTLKLFTLEVDVEEKRTTRYTVTVEAYSAATAEKEAKLTAARMAGDIRSTEGAPQGRVLESAEIVGIVATARMPQRGE